jgi:hypothetical protein
MDGQRPRTVQKLFALEYALRHPRLSKGDASVLAILIEYTSGIHGYAWPSVETIAEVARLTERAVQHSLRRLEAVDLIATEPGGGRGRPSRYRVRLNAFDESPLSGAIKQAAERGSSRSPFSDAKGRRSFHPLETERVNSRSEKGELQFQKQRTPVHPNPSDRTHLNGNPSAYAGTAPSAAAGGPVTDGHAGRLLAEIERAATARGYLTDQEYAQCNELWERYDAHHGDSIGGWAYRLLQTLG